jgi:hypothetical protein
MRDLQQVYTFANRFKVERRGELLRLITSSPPTTVAATSSTVAAITAIASPTVEPTAAISVVTMVSVSETSVVAARRPASAATTTGAQNEACYHGDHDYRHDYKEHSHPNSPFTGFPRFRLQLTGSTTLL